MEDIQHRGIAADLVLGTMKDSNNWQVHFADDLYIVAEK
jgi:hypothetical protein